MSTIIPHTLLDYNAKELYPKTAIDCIFSTNTEYADSSTGVIPDGSDLIKKIIKKEIKDNVAEDELAKDTNTSGPLMFYQNGDTWGIYQRDRTPSSKDENSSLYFFSKNNTYIPFNGGLFNTNGNVLTLKFDTDAFNSDSSGLTVASLVEPIFKPAESSTKLDYGSAYIVQLNIDKNGGLAYSFLKKTDVAEKISINKSNTKSTYYLVGTNVKDDETAGKLYKSYSDESSNIYWKDFNLYQTSDEKLKEFISDIDVDLDSLKGIKKMRFSWKDDADKRSNIGVTAQSIETLFPELVSEDQGNKSVAYDKLGVVALAAIDKLTDKIHELENTIDSLKNEIKELKNSKA